LRKIKQLRRMLGLTQSDIASRAGILYSRITFAETNRRKLTKDEMHRIRRVLRRRIRELTAAV
jgi:transcriptional regulator with XRE-family HTH domain